MAEKAEKVTPNVVPNFATPDPVPAQHKAQMEQKAIEQAAQDPKKFKVQIPQELRSILSRIAQGYALRQVEYLENQRHKAPFKRDERWKADIQNVELDRMIQVFKTTRTIMMDRFPDWMPELVATYGPTEDAFKANIGEYWNYFLKQVEAPEKVEPEPEPEVEEEPVEEEDALAPEEEPEKPKAIDLGLPSARVRDFAEMEKAKVAPPKEPTLADILGKIDKDNSED